MQKWTLGLVTVVSVVAVGAAVAQNFTHPATDEFDFGPFKPQTLEVAVATNKKTGAKMNFVKLKNGHFMAMVASEKYMALMTPTASDDMVQ